MHTMKNTNFFKKIRGLLCNMSCLQTSKIIKTFLLNGPVYIHNISQDVSAKRKKNVRFFNVDFNSSNKNYTNNKRQRNVEREKKKERVK